MKTYIHARTLTYIYIHAAELSDLEVDRKKITLTEQLGEGSVGPVLLGAANGIVLQGQTTQVGMNVYVSASRNKFRHGLLYSIHD